MYKILYPGGKEKAVTFSYDDGTIHDRRLIQILDKYGLKGTVHLNSGRMDVDGYIHSAEVKTLYAGHEVACHGMQHLFLNQISDGELVRELLDDRRRLEQLSGRIVTGMSYAFGVTNDKIIAAAKMLGIQYSRTVADTGSYFVPEDFMRWHPTCHHQKAIECPEIVDTFLNPPRYMRPELLYIWGHSYEFAMQNNWTQMEALCERLSGNDNIWYATNIEIYRYRKAAEQLIESADGSMIENPTGIRIWIEQNGVIKIV